MNSIDQSKLTLIPIYNPGESSLPGDFKVLSRLLTESDAKALRHLRLRALQEDAMNFLADYVAESERTIEQWRDLVIENSEKGAFFGAFVDESLVGIYGVKSMYKTQFGEVAYWCSEYTAPEVRNHNVASNLYKMRSQWCVAHGFKQAVFIINETNIINRGFHSRRGAQVFDMELKTFSNNQEYRAFWYVKNL